MRSPPEVTISTSASGNSPEIRLKLAVAGGGYSITWSEKLVGDMTTVSNCVLYSLGRGWDECLSPAFIDSVKANLQMKQTSQDF